jgi:uncharacterized protein with HEPN domain
MSRDFRLFLDDILESSRNARSYVDGVSYEEFAEDQKTVDAVVRNLEIIGEAVKNIPPEITAARPDIEWKQIARFRDLIVHRYFRIKLTIVWDILQNRLSELEGAVADLLSKLPEPDDLEASESD